MDYVLKSAKQQRLKALKLAFKIIDCFAIPSLSPNQFNEYEKIKKVLIKRYG